ncbi:unnamed protein product [Notodromas monacha]|uniref:DmX-like protein 2 n=1 Tax=Notodromas monacha TaxID=399045 RepID=A0A7R9BLN9_9CRUS|nr:unnamed protein product [Notodromas monacha]CAG0916295.1 unnamed protein product [Notodromas monacha]
MGRETRGARVPSTSDFLWLTMAILSCLCVQSSLSSDLVHSVVLKPDVFVVHWTPDETHITFEIVARTHGFVGLGFSTNGRMQGADFMIGWVQEGIPFVQWDRCYRSGYSSKLAESIAMNCHQILTGACNAGDRTFSVGSVEGVPFTAYAGGCNIVILASNFERVQIIPGVIHENVQITCIDCSTDTGKIAAAYGDKICIFEPVPLINHNPRHNGQAGVIGKGVALPKGSESGPVPNLPSTYSAHDFHSYIGINSCSAPVIHFHLAGSINAETDIPLVPSMKGNPNTDSGKEPEFVVHWLNNKEMHFTAEAESILLDLGKKAIEEEIVKPPVGKDGAVSDSDSTCGPDSDAVQSELGSPRKLGSVRSPSEAGDADQLAGKNSSATSTVSGAIGSNDVNIPKMSSGTNLLGDALDRKIELLLRDWHHSPDLLFAIHPVDGSFLIFFDHRLVDNVDEIQPNGYRQPQVSFACRIPNALPLGDAASMSPNVALYSDHLLLDLKHALGLDISLPKAPKGVEKPVPDPSTVTVEEDTDRDQPSDSTCGDEDDDGSGLGLSKNTSPTISMLSKHVNGSLNLWRVTFGEGSQYSQVLSIGHVSRVCGHRFRVNYIACHPALSLLVSTSHHNTPIDSPRRNSAPVLTKEIPTSPEKPRLSLRESLLTKAIVSKLRPDGKRSDPAVSFHNGHGSDGFCSELILWKVDPVGPLSKTGGVTELARLTSPQPSAFSNCAWIPTLLPSATLGSISNSPSGCFVASDGTCLRVYQAVIDARSLLAEITLAERKRQRWPSGSSGSSTTLSGKDGKENITDAINIVSQQSTARPGCIIQLDAIADATHDWQNTEFLHVFQEQLITGERPGSRKGLNDSGINSTGMGLIDPKDDVFVDLEQSAMFHEPFYVILIEGTPIGSILHMWKLIISSQPSSDDGNAIYTDSCGVDADGVGISCSSPRQSHEDGRGRSACPVLISTEKVCTQPLALPRGTTIIHAAPVAGHLSSASIYPACFAPYLIVTACSDNTVRFWKCDFAGDDCISWKEWNMSGKDGKSRLSIPGTPLNVSAAYTGRVACAYQLAKLMAPDDEDFSRLVNLCVAIYECESTGETFRGLIAVPSYSTLQTLKRSIIEKGNIVPVPQKKHLMQIDWVSREDGSHLLTIGVGSKVLIFTPISSDVAQSNLAAMKESQTQYRPVLKKASSMVSSPFPLDEIRWMKVREVMLHSADGLPALPMHTSWVRDGILVVAMDSEMHVYSQWKPRYVQDSSQVEIQGGDDMMKSRCLTESDLRSLAQESAQRRLAHVGSLANLPRTVSMAKNVQGQAIHLSEITRRKMKLHGVVGVQESHRVMQDELPDFGLFEASRIVCPVLPQYHPKQLMELLNSGKIRRVKAILAHLVRCITSADGVAHAHSSRRASEENSEHRRRSWSRSRALSVSGPSGGGRGIATDTVVPEELTLDYVEISSIPPLPLWVLLQADSETGPAGPGVNQGTNANVREADAKKDYSDLFNTEVTNTDDDNLDELLSDDVEDYGNRGPDSRRRSLSADRRGFTNFGPREARVLSQLLTHTHLPGLSSLDQMHLLALADTVASCNLNFAERFAIDVASAKIGRDGNAATPGVALHQSVDDCGLRFLLAMKHHSYLMRCLPIAQRAVLQKQGMTTNTLVWAFHSESEEEILQTIPSYTRGDIKWADLREIGAGWWLRNHTALRRCIEKVAKAAFQNKQDPLDAAIFYLAMKKKSLLYALYKSIRETKMAEFFANDFNDPRWSKAALKNAYALLGKQRFEHAAAFFLLGGALNDAVQICVTKLHDLQLGMVLCRLFDGEREKTPPSLRRVLNEEILGCDAQGKNQNLDRAHANPSVFNFYTYLRTHPLIIRQHLANSTRDTSLIGFGSSGGAPLFEECITSVERMLYFTTAHAHFRAGCPALALEVLSKLPNLVVVDEEGTIVAGLTRGKSIGDEPRLVHQKSIATGNLDDEDLARTDAIDWSAPSIKKEEELVLEWSDGESDEDHEGIQFPKEEKKKILEESSKLSAIPSDRSQRKSGKFDIMAQQLKFIACLQILMEELSTLATGCEVDGGQLRFQLYVWLEREVHALRQLCNYNEDLEDTSECDETLGEMDGSRGYPMNGIADKPTLHEILLADKADFEAKIERAVKRKQWLRANQTLLRTLQSYCSLHGASGGGLASVRMELVLLLQELQQERAISGLGAAQNHLSSPLPLPTTLPLLAASVAPDKTVVYDPIKHLQSLAHDLLQASVEIFHVPIPGTVDFPRMFVMRDLSIALSSCVYQCLCDSDSFVVKQHRSGLAGAALESLLQKGVVYQNAHLTAGLWKKKANEEALHVTTAPNKWPGVTSLRALLARERDEDAPKLNVLLCESFVAVYVSLFVFGLATCDCHVLYRLIAQDFTETTWAALFGGGVKKLIKVSTSNSSILPQTSMKEDSPGVNSDQDSGILSSLTKQRLKLNMRLLSFSGQQHTSLKQAMKEDRPTYREHFVPPEMSFLALLMSKPNLKGDKADIDYDSTVGSEASDSESNEEDDFEEDVFKEPIQKKPDSNSENTEHLDPYSYSWGILRCAIVKMAQDYLTKFLNVAGFELQELPVASPLMHTVLRILHHWSKSCKEYLDACNGPPEGYIPGCYIDRAAGGPAISKYKTILDPKNTPFPKSSHTNVRAIKRLWMYLVHEESVQEVFIRYIFSTRHRNAFPTISMSDSTLLIGDEASNTTVTQVTGSNRRLDFPDAPPVPGPVKVIHKEHDSISAFCISKTNPGVMALATLKEIQELDIALLLQAPAWLEDECEFDILNLHRDAESLPSSNYLVISERPSASQLSLGGSGTPVGPPGISSSASSNHPLSMAAGVSASGQNLGAQNQALNQTGRGSTVLRHHKIDNVKRLSAHPLLPLYLSGSQDGSVSLWEWDHATPISQPRSAGAYAKVTRVRFSQHGNKFGVSDCDGNVSLWQLGLNSVVTRPFYTVQCHSKQTNDFAFIGGNSLFASAGHGSENRNVCLWDTLLPIKRSLVQTFSCHDQGCLSLTYAPQHQLLISGGKKGDVCLIDVRQRSVRHTFPAHNSAVKAVALDPNEEFFVTGSADGDIKVWGLTMHSMVYAFPGEHARSSFFKAQGQGVTQLHVDFNGRLFSCGADGSLKLRHLPVHNSLFM